MHALSGIMIPSERREPPLIQISVVEMRFREYLADHLARFCSFQWRSMELTETPGRLEADLESLTSLCPDQ